MKKNLTLFAILVLTVFLTGYAYFLQKPPIQKNSLIQETPLAPCFSFTQATAFSTPPALVPYREGNLWGYVTPEKSLAIRLSYKMAYPFRGEFARVEVHNENYPAHDGFSPQYGTIEQVINKHGEVVVQAHYIRFMTDTLIEVTCDDQKGMYSGVFDLKKRKIIVPIQWDSISYETKTHVITGESKSQNPHITLYSTDGKIIFDAPEDLWVIPAEEDKVVLVNKNNQTFSVITTTGEILLKKYPADVDIYNTGEGFIPFKDKNTNLYGYLRINGTTAITPTYCYTQKFSHGLAVVYPPNTKGECPRNEVNFNVIDTQGKTIVKNFANGKYNCIGNFNQSLLLPVCNYDTQKCGIVDLHNKTIVPFQYSTGPKCMGAYFKEDGTFSGGLLDKDGSPTSIEDYYNADGKFVKRVNYSEDKYFYNHGPYLVEQEDLRGLRLICLNKENCEANNLGYLDDKGTEYWRN
jgi:hypothetical protein